MEQIALDQVLEQSGALLGAQREDITRARLGADSDDDTDPDADEEEEEEDQVEGEEGDSDDEDDEDETNDNAFGSHMLLGLTDPYTDAHDADEEENDDSKIAEETNDDETPKLGEAQLEDEDRAVRGDADTVPEGGVETEGTYEDMYQDEAHQYQSYGDEGELSEGNMEL